MSPYRTLSLDFADEREARAITVLLRESLRVGAAIVVVFAFVGVVCGDCLGWLIVQAARDTRTPVTAVIGAGWLALFGCTATAICFACAVRRPSLRAWARLRIPSLARAGSVGPELLTLYANVL